jgi:hypothetical protein
LEEKREKEKKSRKIYKNRKWMKILKWGKQITANYGRCDREKVKGEKRWEPLQPERENHKSFN